MADDKILTVFRERHPDLLEAGLHAEEELYETARLLIEAAEKAIARRLSVGQKRSPADPKEALQRALSQAADSIRSEQPKLFQGLVDAWANSAVTLPSIQRAVEKAAAAAQVSTPRIAYSFTEASKLLVIAATRLLLSTVTLMATAPNDPAATAAIERVKRAVDQAKDAVSRL